MDGYPPYNCCLTSERNWGLRDIVLFSSHSFIKDPPFSRLDLISCPNVMIDLGQDLQHKLIPLFHYALRPVDDVYAEKGKTPFRSTACSGSPI